MSFTVHGPTEVNSNLSALTDSTVGPDGSSLLHQSDFVFDSLSSKPIFPATVFSNFHNGNGLGILPGASSYDIAPVNSNNHVLLPSSVGFHTSSVPVSSSENSLCSRSSGNSAHDATTCLISPSVNAGQADKNWIQLQYLAPSTTRGMLKSFFYPLGGDETRIIRVNGQLLGLVGFRSAEMASAAAEKAQAFFSNSPNRSLRVTAVSLEEVQDALGRAKLQPTSMLYAALAEETLHPARIAQIIENLPFSQAVSELGEEVLHADEQFLTRITDALHSIHPEWSSYHDFGADLLQRLHIDLIQSKCSYQSTNIGVVIGNLYLCRMVHGDPFHFASNFLHRVELCVPHVEGICMIAHICFAMHFKSSQSSFWSMVRELGSSSQISSELQKALMYHLLRYFHMCRPQELASLSARQAAPLASTLSSLSNPKPMTAAAPPSGTTSPEAGRFMGPLQQPTPPTGDMISSVESWRASSLGRAGWGEASSAEKMRSPGADEDPRLRTVYISHLPPNLPQDKFMELLSSCGVVNKVRICAGKGYTTLFSFVEMGTCAGANQMLKLSGLIFLGYSIRVLMARNPIQDDLSEDAEILVSGVVRRPCQFGRSDAPLIDAVSAMDAK